MAARQPVICFAGDNYWYSNPHSRYHLMHALHRRGHPILWVNSIGMNLPRLRRNGLLTRVGLKLKSWARWLGQAHEHFHVLTPIALPLYGHGGFEAANERWIGAQIDLARRRLGLREPLIFASIPSYAGVVDRLPHAGLIYYYSDKYAAYRDITAREAIAARDRLLYERADVVFCASERIRADLPHDRGHVHVLRHAVDFPHFHGAVADPPPEPADLAAVPRPRIGYFGSLTDSNDIAMILHAAREAPELHFVLIGRVLGDYAALAALPNVHLLGFKDYRELPAYGCRFDVAFMCWKLTDWIRHSNPLKTKEYLSMGLPVVSVRIEQLERELGEHLYFADDGPGFLAAIRRALAEDGPERRAARIAAVRHESWDARAAEMMERFAAARGGVQLG
jgi:hypothetical protein